MYRLRLWRLDWIGVTLAGSTHKTSKLFVEAISKFNGKKQSTVLGFNKTMDIFMTSLLNGYFSHILDFDDIQLDMIGHPSAPVIPGILSLAEWKKKSGAEFLLAYVTAVEIECRLGEAVNPQHYERGWHSTSTLGHFGAAVGTAKLLKLDSEKIIHALGIAGTQASGLRQVFGTMSKPFNPGKAAMNGTMAAILAGQGMTSSENIIEGEKGFVSVYCDSFDSNPFNNYLRQSWKVEEIIFKKYASCFRTHAVIECMLSLRKCLINDLNEIRSIICRVSPLAFDMAGILYPKTGLEGKFSQSFCAAIALVDGKADENSFIDENISHPLIHTLIKKTKVTVDEKLSSTEASVDVGLQDDKVYTERIDTLKNQSGNHRLIEELKNKFINLVSSTIDNKDIQELYDAIMNLEFLSDITTLIKLCPSINKK